MVFNYVYRFGIQLWRRKTSLLIAAALLLIITAGLNYNRNEISMQLSLNRDDKNNYLADAKGEGVHFVGSKDERSRKNPSTELNVEALGKKEEIRDSLSKKIEELTDPNAIRDLEQQLGVPYVNLDLKNPYIPKQRLVHFDLKGAPPKVSYIKRVLPLIKTMGATGILIEYEDMFPYKGALKEIAAKNAYSEANIESILQAAEEHNLEVIPLVQTFGHVEFALKHVKWSQLREVPGSPQALCPSRNMSMDYIKDMVDQVLALHPGIRYLHIGCDEVFQMGQCELCRMESYENIFLHHVRKVAQTIRAKYPHIKLIIWDDMLRHLSQQSMIDASIGSLVEPMVWVYAEDIYRFVQTQVWEKYAAVFKTAWTASAFKGAFGETLYVPDARRHLENNLRWLDVMSQQESLFKNGFTGIALTGWQRYDHFAVLCELFPAAFPSLALSLLAVSHGYFNRKLQSPVLSALSCPMVFSSRSHAFVTLDTDPFLWERMNRCMFPGSPFFRLTYRLHMAELEAQDFITVTRKRKGWMTEYNARHNYSLPLRVNELIMDLPKVLGSLHGIAKNAVDTMNDIFDIYTIGEWIEQRVYPYIIEIEKIQNESVTLLNIVNWESRPLKPLEDLKRIGVALPDEL